MQGIIGATNETGLLYCHLTLTFTLNMRDLTVQTLSRILAVFVYPGRYQVMGYRYGLRNV
jgi:hypothetical protein